MSTQAWGFQALLGCRRKAPSPPKGRKVGCDAGGHPSPWPLIFSLCRRRVECVPHTTGRFPGVRRIWKCGPPPAQTEELRSKERKACSLMRPRWRRVQPVLGVGRGDDQGSAGRALGTREGGDPALGSWLQVRGSSAALGRREHSPVAGGSAGTQEDGGWERRDPGGWRWPARGSRDQSPQETMR